MVILITGASHTGKTLLAQNLLEKHGYPYLSIDHLKMGLIRSGQTALTPCDDEKLTEYLWPIVREIIKTAVENKQNLVVEGAYVPFGWRADFDSSYLSSIEFVCIAMTDSYIDANFANILKYANAIEARQSDGSTVSGLKEDNRKCLEGFNNAGEHVTLIDADYQDAVGALLDELSGRIR